MDRTSEASAGRYRGEPRHSEATERYPIAGKGSRLLKFHESLVRVRYAETDVMGFVYHSNYFVWFEVGRVEYMRAVGFNYRDLETEEGIHLPVLECSCRFVHPARYDDPIKIRTSVKEVTRVRMTFEYQARHAESGEVLAEGQTAHVFTDRDGKPKRLPPDSQLWLYLRERVSD